MMQFQTVLQTFEELNIHAFFLKKDFSNVHRSDNSMKKSLYANYSYAFFAHDILPLVQKTGDVCMCSDMFDTANIIARIPNGFGNADDELPILVFGPFIYTGFSFEQINLAQQQNNIPESFLPVIKQFIENMPLIPDAEKILTIMPRILSHVFGIRFIATGIVETDSENHNTFNESAVQSSAELEARYAYENAFLDAVSSGNSEAALTNYDKFNSMNGIKERATSRLRNRQNYTIILNTLLRKAAETGGVHPLYIDYLSSAFAIEINRASTVNSLVQLSRRMVLEYANLVLTKSMAGIPKVIKEVVQHIDFHYADALTLSSLSERFNISEQYLSKLFHRELHMTLTEYIRSVRLKKAKQLLKSSSLQLEDIAQLVGYDNANYFIRIFKNAYNTTPKQFQKKCAVL